VCEKERWEGGLESVQEREGREGERESVGGKMRESREGREDERERK
jgi:hypothetical protein